MSSGLRGRKVKELWANCGHKVASRKPSVTGANSHSSSAFRSLWNLPAEDSGTFNAQNWAQFNPGPNETDTVVQYNVSAVTNPGLFVAQPLVANNGTLSFTPAANQNGSSMFTVTVQDNGGTSNNGLNTSTPVPPCSRQSRV